MITEAKARQWQGAFLPFGASIAIDAPKAIVLISRHPAAAGDGSAGPVTALAEALGADGHIVCLVTESADVSRVDFEHGVWVHRIAVPVASNWPAASRAELSRIATHRNIDAVEVALGSDEAAALLDDAWPLVVQLPPTLTAPLTAPQNAMLRRAKGLRGGDPALARQIVADLGIDASVAAPVVVVPTNARLPAGSI